MKFLSLFAGIGGFDLGLERSGWQCVGQVEIDPFCQKVLAKHWPNVPRFDDVRTVTAELIRERCGVTPLSAASRAKTFQQPTLPEKGLMANVPVYGVNSTVSFAKFDRQSRSLRTCQTSLGEDWIGYSLILPMHGTMRSGELFQRACWAQHTHAKDCSFWPTPTASEGSGGGSASRVIGRFTTGRQVKLRDMYKFRMTGKTLPVRLVVLMMGFPEDWIDLDERVAKKEKLRGIGNAVVPQVAEVLGRAILKTFGEGEK